MQIYSIKMNNLDYVERIFSKYELLRTNNNAANDGNWNELLRTEKNLFGLLVSLEYSIEFDNSNE